MKKSTIILFLQDRLLYMYLCLLIIGLGTGIMLVDNVSPSGLIDEGIIFYFILLSLFLMGLWLVIDYLRQKAYYNQVNDAINRSDVEAIEIVQAMVTREQYLVARLLQEQYSSYLNELRIYRRQQELHNHFVLQWVHHMKTPVSVIDLLIQEALQQMPYTEEEQEQLVVSIQEETNRMTRDLEMMLYTARLEKFEIDSHLKKIPLHKLISTVINAHKSFCIRYSIYPRIDGEAWIETDEKWMKFVLNQLVSNAIKYSKGKPGAKQLVFCLEESVHGGGKLSVVDEGIGIASHDLPRVFEPFFTGENGRTAGESTGMGLYLAKEVCNRLGHALSVTSVLGEGTTFIVSYEPRGIHMFDIK
ncbi:sensor histidine kinase [Bacillus gaemokensis]|uniref:histidine kinase n=1 Tax=Bacillus gaemokensis TaxID=574375 RepID=A0A073KHX6_9BACI|nr:sensor histidine kinase [Bacillus gaemokensis]KEK21913.1 histidine kinase [Bacillus gaemokensis]KYG36481.1 histidine kinase [Bacillus gaemokensis]